MVGYQVTVTVLVQGPENYTRSAEKLVHSLVQEELPGADEGQGELKVIGASAIFGKTKIIQYGKKRKTRGY
jgi:hypothetical protein